MYHSTAGVTKTAKGFLFVYSVAMYYSIARLSSVNFDLMSCNCMASV